MIYINVQVILSQHTDELPKREIPHGGQVGDFSQRNRH